MPLLAAVALALASAVSYAVAAVLQQREASRHRQAGSGLVRHLARRRAWWASIVAMGTGAALHVAALGLGPLVLVQPIGVSALVLALLFGTRRSGRPSDRGAWIPPICVVAGLATVLTVLPHTAPTARTVTSYGAAAAVVLAAAGVAALAAVLTVRRRPAVGSALYAIGAALCFGLTSGTVKAVWLGEASGLAVAVGLCAAGVGFVLVQYAYRDGGLGAPLALLTLVDPLAAAAIGVAAFGESLPTSPVAVTVGVMGVLLTVLGVTRLSRRDTVPPGSTTRTAARPRAVGVAR